MRRVCLLTAGILLLASASLRAQTRPMTVDDLLGVKSVSDPQVSPGGGRVVYVVSEIDRASNKSNSSLWMVGASGGEPSRLTSAPGTNNHPRWSPDGKTIAFTSSRGGSSQVWLLPLDGGEAQVLTKLPIDASGPLWSPSGDQIAFTAEVYPGKTVDETAAKDKEVEASKSNARVYDRLMIRHWTAWDEKKRSHLFVADAKTGEAKDLTPKLEVNTPPAPFGGSNDYAWSPDGKELAFTAEPLKDSAWSTNTDLWTVPVDGGEPKNLTADNPGADSQPSYSPDGGWIAFVRQTRAGFEADQWVLTLYNRKTNHIGEVTRTLDRSIGSFVWSGPLGFTAVIDEGGTEPIIEFTADVESAEGGFNVHVGKYEKRVTGGMNSGLQAGFGSKPIIYLHSTADRPGEVYKANRDGSGQTRLTRHNEGLVAGLDLARAESFTFKGADDDDVSGWLIKPPKFDAGKKYPVLLLIHGGPQGAWHDEWHARWNYQMFASPGFAVVAVNPRGSTGYGQKFTDQISKDWTGRVYEDLIKGLDHALKTYSFLDSGKIGAAGGSYGGFMVNWIAGHSDRFKALVSHAGVFDLESMYGTSEELWFTEWEFGGPPWKHPEIYREQSPSTFAGNFKTPTLVTHGALDFRVPDAQGLGMFTCLQRQGVPSRYVFFPDEGHWILKPANRVVWWGEMLGWLEKYLK